uniref:Protein TIC 214 n=1 Tax=Schoepfia jasminodora TaxID=212711 RepID=A0A343B8W7_9MAGN|nr:hypothetical chloroplast RF19 [Schoepfia jasminodora]AQW41736.1 hypothetical chloroplast RF19 [Schoepfia jasminodora]
MIFRSFLLGNLVSLYMKRVNLAGLYYGFLTTFSIGPSYLLLCQARVMEEREEGVETKVSATTGFITGQLMMFISIYYTPLHLALGRPYIITVLAPSYLLFHFFRNNHKDFLGYEFTTKNIHSMRNLSIQCIFMTNLIFKLFNYSLLLFPSSMLARLVNIYMFRCNNKMLFVTSSFVGWLMGHILLIKWVEFILVWIRQNYSNRSNKYLMAELTKSTARISSILLFITCIYYLDRIPSPILTTKPKEPSKNEEETDIETENTLELTSIQKEKQEVSLEDDSSPFSEKSEKLDETHEIRLNGKTTAKLKDKLGFKLKTICYKTNLIWETFYSKENQDILKFKKRLKNQEDKNFLWPEKPLVTLLFDYKGWNRPFRYIKNDRFENAIRNEMSQYFFDTCQSDGKLKISFTYLTSLETFLEMIQKTIALSIYKIYLEKLSSNELYTYWLDTTEQKKDKQTNEVLNKIAALYKDPSFLMIQRIRFWNRNNTKKKYWPKLYDPFLNGPYRGTVKKSTSPSIISKTPIKDFIEPAWINKIHGILFIAYREFEQKMDKTFEKKSLSTRMGHLLTLISEFAKESTCNFNLQGLVLSPEQGKIYSEDREKFFKLLFDPVMTDPNNQKVILKESSEVKAISKKVSQWTYKLIDEMDQKGGENEENMVAEDHEIRSRKAKRVVIFTDKQPNTYTNVEDANDPDEADEVALIRYSQQSDFRRAIIKGSMRTQRRQTFIGELFQTNIHSPLFRGKKKKLFYFEISELMKFIFRNGMDKNEKLKISYNEGETKEIEKNEEDKREEKARIAIAEAWDTILFAQILRGCVLITQSNFRKYIKLPLLIMTKNIGRILLFQFPEWSEDLKKWKKEMHVKCTYHGVQLSETEFPKNWLTDGIQIKILFPFDLKRSKPRFFHRHPMKKKRQKDSFFFLTVLGMEAKLPFGSPQNGPSFFESIFKKLEKKIIKLKKRFFLALSVLKERLKFVLRVSKETTKLVIKNLFFFKRILLLKVNPILLLESNQPKYMNWTRYSLTENKIKDLTDKRNAIRGQIKKNTKNRKKEFITTEIKISPTKKSENYKKRLESSKKIWQILKKKRRNARLIRKFNYFLEKIYINTLFCIIKISGLNAQFFIKSAKKLLDKYISNNEETKKRIDKRNQTTIDLSSTLKKLLYILSNRNSHIFFVMNLSYLSQRYLFLQFSQIKMNNLHRLRYVLQYHKTPVFFKNGIKDYFRIQGILHSDYKLKHNKLLNFKINQWKNWLRGHYPYEYELSPIRWSRLVPQTWRKKINQHFIVQNKDLNKGDLSKKKKLIHCKKQTHIYYEGTSLSNQNNTLKKHYRYNFLASKSSNLENRKDSYIYGSSFQTKNEERVYYNYNKQKRQLLDIFGNTLINNYLRDNDIRNTEKKLNRKYFDCPIIQIYLKKKKEVDVEAWIDTSTNRKKTMKTGTKNSKKMEKKSLFYLPTQKEINQSKTKKVFFFSLNWLGMNNKILNRPICHLGLWFFPKFVFLYAGYKIKPWDIPIKLLLLNFSENAGEIKNIKAKKKKDFELDNKNKEEKEYKEEGNLGSEEQTNESPLSNQQIDHYMRSNMKKRSKKNGYKSNTEAELDLFLKRYLLFQLRWNDPLTQKMINNIKVYCFLLRLRNPKEICLSSIRGGEMSMDIMPIQNNFTLKELMKKEILIIEPVRLSGKSNRQLIMDQTLRISLVHKSKYQTNQVSPPPKNLDFIKIQKSAAKRQNRIGTKDGNRYNLFFPENILSPRRRREFRILICFNSRNRTKVDRNSIFCNREKVKNCGILDENKHVDKAKLIQFTVFIWPNYRFEDLTCMNRYWFDSNNGNCFSMLKIHMYP